MRGTIGTAIALTGDFGAAPVPVVFAAGSIDGVEAEVRSWSPSQVIVSVPMIGYGTHTVALPGGCQLSSPPSFEVIPPPRIYINNNANNADGFNTITTMIYDPVSGALTQMGPPTSIGVPASGRPGCSESLTIAGGSRLYASGDTGVAVLDIDPATGALRPSSSGLPYFLLSTGVAALYGGGGYLWAATDAGIMAWRPGVDHLPDGARVSQPPARTLVIFGSRPSQIYSTRGDGTFDGWSVSYQAVPGGGAGAMPVLTPFNGSPFGTPTTSMPDSGLVYASRRDGDLLYVPTAAGLGLWRIDRSARTATEIADSPFALNPPSGTLSRPVFSGSRQSPAIYMAAAGSGYIVGATLDPAGAPSAVPGSPWNFAPDLTNISCMTTAAGSTPTGRRLIVTDAGNRRVGVFDIPAGATVPIQVPGSPFPMTDTPSELASGIAILGAP